MKAEIETFLDLIKSSDGDGRERLQALADALDRLALAYSRTSCLFDEIEYPEAPVASYQMFVDTARTAYPELECHYSCVDPLKLQKQEVMLGDGIDDIADIARDLSEVLWRLDHTSADDAAWYFRFSYESHWGRHLHHLRLLVFEKLHA